MIDDQQERLAIQTEPPLDIPKFEFIHNAEILKTLKPINWTIEGILADFGMYYNFGDPGHYKTFLEIDRLLCISAGFDYHGHSVKQGPVFYIAGEGQQGIGRRIAAWHAAHKTKAADVPFFISKTPTQLMDPGAVNDVQKAVDFLSKRHGHPRVVFIDTLGRNFGDGDENSTADMNRVIHNLDSAFGNSFCRGLNHHTGHADKTRARGSIALHGAADGAYRISLTAGGQVLVECKKQKDAPEHLPMLFDRREVLLQIGDTPDRSYVLELAAEGEEALKMAKSGQPITTPGKTGEALEVLREMYAACRCNLDASGRPGAMPHVTVKAWQEACFKRSLFGARAYNFKRAAANLFEKKLIQYDGAGVHVYPIELFEQD